MYKRSEPVEFEDNRFFWVFYTTCVLIFYSVFWSIPLAVLVYVSSYPWWAFLLGSIPVVVGYAVVAALFKFVFKHIP